MGPLRTGGMLLQKRKNQSVSGFSSVMIPKINCQSYLFFKLALFFGLLILTGAAISPPDAYAHDRLLLFYSGNVNGEIEGCG